MPPWLCCQLVITTIVALHPPVCCSHQVALHPIALHLAVSFFSFRLMSMEFYPLAFKFPYFSFQYCCQTFFSCTIVLPFCGIIHLPFFGITFSLFPTCWPGPLVMLCMGSCLDHQGTSSPLSTSELTSHAKVGHR